MSLLSAGKDNVTRYVAVVCVLSAVAMYFAWQVRAPFPGTMAMVSTFAVAVLLDRSRLKYRVGASGSTAFVVHIAATALFGGFWGALVTGVSSLVDDLSQKKTGLKALFNTAQRVLCVASAALVYQVGLGGTLPPAFLTASEVSAELVQRTSFSSSFWSVFT